MAGKPSNPNIKRPDRLRFVDKPCSEKAVLQRYVTAQAMFIPMIKYDSNNIERSGTMYVINESENNPELGILEKIPNIWIYGVKALIEQSTKLTLSVRQKHLYCTSMYGLCFYICCPNKNNLMMQPMIKLIKFVVGSLSRVTNKSLTHMITTSLPDL